MPRIETLVLRLQRELKDQSDLGEFGAYAIHRALLDRATANPPAYARSAALWRDAARSMDVGACAVSHRLEDGTCRPSRLATRSVRTYDLAVEHLRSYRPDILITDLQLGDADGWHLAYEARRDQPLLSVVIVTAWLYLSDLAPGGPGIPVFVKPFDPEELLRRLQSMC